MPYPPNKGDKVRSFNILKYLSDRHNVYLGTFVDDSADEKYISTVKSYCKFSYFKIINKKYSRLRSLLGFFTGKALSLEYYNYLDFHSWVSSTIKNNKIDAVVIFSSVMAQYLDDDIHSRMVIDFVDVDSQKWSEYAQNFPFPFSLIYKREGKYLLSYESYLASQARHSFFVTEKERNLFSQCAPESFLKTSALNNGVDSDFFTPNLNILNPFQPVTEDLITLVFTGAMDYWPNIDAVVWFVNDVLSVLVKKHPSIRFYIVGRSPSKTVLNLVSKTVFVTGTVDDVRPYLQHATAVVAPLRIARGIQNKILEAMSMAKPVVASAECVKALNAVKGNEIISAVTAEDFIDGIEFIVNNIKEAKLMGCVARERVIESYSWTSHLKGMDKYLKNDLTENII